MKKTARYVIGYSYVDRDDQMEHTGRFTVRETSVSRAKKVVAMKLRVPWVTKLVLSNEGWAL
jgi:hypothetical protein